MTSEIPALLHALYPEVPAGEQFELRTITPGRGARSHFFASAEAVARAAAQLTGRANLYVGVALRRGGGDKAHCTRVAAVWVDQDYKHYPDEDGAAAALERFPLPHSAVVASGGGLQPYWFLREAAEPDEFERVEAVNRGLTSVLAPEGSRLDAATDVSRILRLPDTLNLKYQPPRRTRLLSVEPTRRYALSDLEAWVPAETLPQAPAGPVPLPPAAGEIPLFRGTREFLAQGAPAGQQRARAVATARNLCSAGYTEAAAVAVLWAALERCPQDPRDPWRLRDAEEIVRSIYRAPPTTLLRWRPSRPGTAAQPSAPAATAQPPPPLAYRLRALWRETQ